MCILGLILMNEISKVTNTNHNNKKFKAKTLIATYYHELNELIKYFSIIKNFTVSVKGLKKKVICLRKCKESGSEHSFGINVANLLVCQTECYHVLIRF